MYSLVPADEEARKAPPREPVFASDEMMKQPRSKTSLFESDKEISTKNRGANLKCQICNKTYKNKKSLADHKRIYHSKLPLRFFASRYDEKTKSDSESDDEKDSTIFDDNTSRKREISTDGDTSPSPTYCRTTKGFGFNVLDANSLPNKVNGEYGSVTICPDF